MIEVNHVLDLGYKPQDASDYENVFRLVQCLEAIQDQ
jgi:hypothetical protein